MKTKKVLLGMALSAVILCLCSCANNTGDNNIPTPKLLTFENGSTNIDPTQVTRIEIRFDKPMDRKVFDFIRQTDTGDEIYWEGWLNDYTIGIDVNLTYGTSYSFVFNDDQYKGDNYTPEKNYIRDANGNYIKRFPVSFTTIPSPTEHPHNYVIDFQSEFTQEWTVKLADNREYYENSQQALVNIKRWLNHDKVKKGDTVEIPYKIKSDYDLHDVKVNLVDTSYSANYWKELSTVQVLVDELKASEPDKEPNYKEGTLKFTITEDMIAQFVLQIFADYGDGADIKNKDLINIIYVPTPSETTE